MKNGSRCVSFFLFKPGYFPFRPFAQPQSPHLTLSSASVFHLLPCFCGFVCCLILMPRLKALATPAAPVMDQPTSSSADEPTIVDVDLGDRRYPMYIGSDLLNQPELLQRLQQYTSRIDHFSGHLSKACSYQASPCFSLQERLKVMFSVLKKEYASGA